MMLKTAMIVCIAIVGFAMLVNPAYADFPVKLTKTNSVCDIKAALTTFAVTL